MRMHSVSGLGWTLHSDLRQVPVSTCSSNRPLSQAHSSAREQSALRREFEKRHSDQVRGQFPTLGVLKVMPVLSSAGSKRIPASIGRQCAECDVVCGLQAERCRVLERRCKQAEEAAALMYQVRAQWLFVSFVPHSICACVT
jgi:hypothetical protein